MGLSKVKGTGLDGFSSPLLFHLETFSTTPTFLDISLYISQMERIMPIYSLPNESEETQQCKKHNISMNRSTLSYKHQETQVSVFYVHPLHSLCLLFSVCSEP